MNRFRVAALFALVSALAFPDFTATFIHTNDLHAHVEPVKIKGVEIGGYARQATLIKKLRAQSINPVLLNGGDTFQGTLFFNVYLGLAEVTFMNQVGYQAMAAGNHEFDRGAKVLADFARLANFPILAANLNVSQDQELKDLIKPSTVIEVGGEKLGVIGAVTPDLHEISSPGDHVKMLELIPSLQAAIDGLKAQGINKIAMVSHCGFGLEREVVSKLSGLDIIVGGHSHTILGTTKLPGDPRSGGKYPTVVKNADGDTALVVQAWEWGKVVGKIEVVFDDSGKIIKWSDEQPIAVTAEIPEDPVVKAMVSALKRPIEDLMNKEVGTSVADIPRNGPGKQGVMADLITDAMLDATKGMGSVVAFMNAGGVRSALNAGKLTYGDVISVQPFNNTLVQIDLTGEEVIAALKSGVLYVSTGSSVKGQEIVIAGKAIEKDKVYRCTFNSFVADGGDGLAVVKSAKGRRVDTGLIDADVFMDFIKKNSPLNLKAEGRIQ